MGATVGNLDMTVLGVVLANGISLVCHSLQRCLKSLVNLQ